MNFNGSLTSGTVPLIVSFTDMSTDSPTNGRGILVIEGVIRTESPHRQTSAGTYSVRLVAMNGGSKRYPSGAESFLIEMQIVPVPV